MKNHLITLLLALCLFDYGTALKCNDCLSNSQRCESIVERVCNTTAVTAAEKFLQEAGANYENATVFQCVSFTNWDKSGRKETLIEDVLACVPVSYEMRICRILVHKKLTGEHHRFNCDACNRDLCNISNSSSIPAAAKYGIFAGLICTTLAKLYTQIL